MGLGRIMVSCVLCHPGTGSYKVNAAWSFTRQKLFQEKVCFR